MRNIAIKLAYDGTNYHGWQSQKNAISVSDTVKKAIHSLTGEDVKLLGCGRTDAGVHAEFYVANFRGETRIPAANLPAALNTRLPEDISCLAAQDVPMEFHAINSCEKKEYTYRIYSAPVRNPMYRKRAWFYPHKLDLERMRRASALFTGRHDFSSMKTSVRTLLDVPRSNVRTVYYYDVERNGDFIEFRVCADGFLYNMVRTMVGTLVYVSEGKIEPEDITEILNKKDRTVAGPTAPAEGLYMTRVWYHGGVEF